MSFTKEQITALKAMDETFGPFPEANPEHVEPLFIGSYVRSVTQYVGYMVDHWKAATLAADPELPAIKQKLREEKARKAAIKNAARSQEIRENLVSGILSGLIPKARKAGKVEFEINDWSIEIMVWKDEERVFGLNFDREDFSLSGYLNHKTFESEDWSALNGNARPRDQSVALNTVLEYLEELD